MREHLDTKRVAVAFRKELNIMVPDPSILEQLLEALDDALSPMKSIPPGLFGISILEDDVVVDKVIGIVREDKTTGISCDFGPGASSGVFGDYWKTEVHGCVFTSPGKWIHPATKGQAKWVEAQLGFPELGLYKKDFEEGYLFTGELVLGWVQPAQSDRNPYFEVHWKVPGGILSEKVDVTEYSRKTKQNMSAHENAKDFRHFLEETYGVKLPEDDIRFSDPRVMRTLSRKLMGKHNELIKD